MRLKRWIFLILAQLLALTACQPAEMAVNEMVATETNIPPTAPAAPSPTARTFFPTHTPNVIIAPTQSATPDLSPAPTLPTFVREGTPLPPSERITAENANQLVELARLGKGRIVDVHLSPDRNFLLVQTSIGVYGWLADSQLEIWQFEDPTGIAAVALPRLERWMAVATNDGQIALLIYRKGTMFTRWDSGQAEIHDLAFSYDGDLLAAVGDQGVTVWQVGETEPLYDYPELRGEKVRFTPDGTVMIVKGTDNTIFVSLVNGQIFSASRTEDKLMWAFSPDGAYFSNGEIVWDGLTGDYLYTFEQPDGIDDGGYVAFSYDSRDVAVNAFHDEFIYILRAVDGKEIMTLRSPFFGLGIDRGNPGKMAAPAERSGGFNPYFTDLAFSPDGNYLVAATSDDAVEIWNLQNGDFEGRISSLGTEVLFRKASRLVVWGYNSLEQVDPLREVSLYLDRDFNSLRHDKLFVHDPISERRVRFSRDGEWVIAENIVWYLPDGQRTYRLGGEAVLAVDLNDEYIYTFDNVTDIVRKRRVGDFSVVYEVDLLPPIVEDLDLTLSGYPIENMSISPDGRFFSGYIDEYGLVTWNLGAGTPIDDLHYSNATYGGGFSPDSQFIYIWGYDGLTIHNLDSYTHIYTLEGSYTSLEDILTFTRDGQHFLISESGIEVYRIHADRLEKTLHIDQPGSKLDISPDYSVIAISIDARLLLLDFETGEVLREIAAHTGEILDITFSQNGRYIATSSWDGTVRIWGIP